MTRKMLIDASHQEECRVAIIKDNRLEDFDYESSIKSQIKSNVYLAKVTRVEPSLQACFVEYGGNRQGFLAFSEIHPDYYQIPAADREALMQAVQDQIDQDAAEEAAEENERNEHDDNHLEEHDEDHLDEQAHHDDDHDEDSTEDDDDSDDPDDKASASKALSADAPKIASAPVEDEAPDEVPNEPSTGESSGASDGGNINQGEKNDDHRYGEGSETREIQAGSPSPESESESESSKRSEPSGDESDENESNENGKGRRRGRGRFRNRDRSNGRNRRNHGERGSGGRHSSTGDSAERSRRNLYRGYKIQEVIKKRQILLIQVVKEERGGKGAALTTYLSLAGRYCVLMPNTTRGGGVSRKIGNNDDRKRLKTILNELEVPSNMAVILRTAGAERSRVEIKRDYEYLSKLWNEIRSNTLNSTAPALIHEEGNIIKRAIRDLYTRDIDEILVQGDDGYRMAKNFMKTLIPSHARKVKQFKNAQGTPLFFHHKVEQQLAHIYDPRIEMRSGGSIVMHQTEALVAIDVNSGKATRERHIEETALKTNLEAAEEIARQLRLRDLAGLVVVDFIDMEDNRNNMAVERKLKEMLRVDRARIQVGRISEFGLLEMSRQRLRPSLQEATSQSCAHCGGSGYVVSTEGAALTILRALEEEALARKYQAISLRVPRDVALYVLNQKRARLRELEELYQITALITPDSSLNPPNFEVTERIKYEFPPIIHQDVSTAQDADESDDTPSNADRGSSYDDDNERKDGSKRKRRGRRGNRNRKPHHNDQDGELQDQSPNSPQDSLQQEAQPEAQQAEPVEAGEVKSDPAEQKSKPRRTPRRHSKSNPKPLAGDDVMPAATEENTATTDGAATDMVADEKPAKPRRTRKPAVKKPQAEPVTQAESQATPTPTPAPTPAPAEIKDEPAKPRKKGWWRNILE